MFNTNLMEFVTGRVNGEYKPGRDGVGSFVELFCRSGSIGGMYGANTGGFTGVVKHNLEQNWGQLVMGAVGIPVIACRQEIPPQASAESDEQSPEDGWTK